MVNTRKICLRKWCSNIEHRHRRNAIAGAIRRTCLTEAMVEELEDRNLVAIARQRLALKDTSIEVDIEEI